MRDDMLKKYFNFIKGVSINKLGKAGVVLTTSSFITFLILEFARVVGLITQDYVGLINYLLFPTLFVIGLFLILLAWLQIKKGSGKTLDELVQEQFPDEETKGHIFGSGVMKMVGILTIINVLFLLIVSTQMLSFMDESHFCGTACHSVMNPEWTTYQQSPHARVACVQCHVGEGVDAMISSKLNGAYQMLSVTFHLYESPIPTPVHQLRPARETCEKCHWPEKFYGSRLKSYVRYQNDAFSTPLYTTLNLKVDIGQGRERAGIHWHIFPENRVSYASIDDKRLQMLWTEVIREDGSVQRFTNTFLDADLASGQENERVMDCVDCHNRATHIYESPRAAVDLRLQRKLMDRSLPYLKREGVAAIIKNYPTKEAGLKGIEKHLFGFYRRNYPQIASAQMDKIDRAVKTLQDIYTRNIHPSMKITWGSYPNFIGHNNNSGCFRCHNEYMKTEEGVTISHDCTTCHSILAQEEPTPFKYLEPVNKKEKNAAQHEYLQDEFLHSYLQ